MKPINRSNCCSCSYSQFPPLLLPGISHGGCGSGHYRGNDRVHLRDGGVGEMQPIGGNGVQCLIVQNDHGVRVLNQASRGWNRVVRLNNDIGSAFLR